MATSSVKGNDMAVGTIRISLNDMEENNSIGEARKRSAMMIVEIIPAPIRTSR